MTKLLKKLWNITGDIKFITPVVAITISALARLVTDCHFTEFFAIYFAGFASAIAAVIFVEEDDDQ